MTLSARDETSRREFPIPVNSEKVVYRRYRKNCRRQLHTAAVRFGKRNRARASASNDRHSSTSERGLTLVPSSAIEYA